MICERKRDNNILFEIERESILFQVKLHSHYRGDAQKIGENVIPATKMQASDDNDDILNGFIDSAASDVSDMLTSVLTELRLEKEDYVTEKNFPSVRFLYYTCVPSTFDNNQKEAILQGIKDYMVNYSLCEWGKIYDPAGVEAYRAECEMAREKIKHRLNCRIKPVRRRFSPTGY